MVAGNAGVAAKLLLFDASWSCSMGRSYCTNFSPLDTRRRREAEADEGRLDALVAVAAVEVEVEVDAVGDGEARATTPGLSGVIRPLLLRPVAVRELLEEGGRTSGLTLAAPPAMLLFDARRDSPSLSPLARFVDGDAP